MKIKHTLLCVLAFLLLNYSVLCQNRVMSDPPVIDETENITADDLRKLSDNIFQSDINIKNILETSLY